MRRILLTLATSALLLAACSNSDTTESTAAPDNGGGNQAAEGHAEHNDADVTFLTMMIPHHEEAVAMAELAATRAQRTEITEMASAIISTQNAEIETMRGWLEEWGESEPSGGHEQMDMPGAMTPEQMEQVEAASGAEFDQMFTDHMIGHHQDAIEMAETVLAEGSSPEVKDLAEQVRTVQQQEIDQMRAWQ